jgi:uncharacterized membrane protein YfcA
MHLDPSDLALIATAFAAALASGLAGFAFALVANGAFLQILPPTTAVPVVLAGSVIAQLFSVFALREAVSWPRLWPFLLGGAIGIPLGAWALLAIDAVAFRVIVGLFLVAYSLYALAAHPPTVRGGGRLADAAIGWVGGVLGGLAALSGAVPTVWCQLRGWPRDQQRGVYQPYIVVMQLLALAALFAAGGIDRATVPVMILTLPAILLGTLAGMRLYARVNDRQFRLIVLLLLLASGTALLLPHAASALR